MSKVLVQYSSCNSGGQWWLKDDDWFALEEAGWIVDWKVADPQESRHHKEGRYLGALARDAEKVFGSVEDAIDEFQQITGQDPYAEGCPCCGPPHGFSGERIDCFDDDDDMSEHLNRGGR